MNEKVHNLTSGCFCNSVEENQVENHEQNQVEKQEENLEDNSGGTWRRTVGRAKRTT